MKQPKLRFPEFTGDWKQHKFEDVVTIGSGKDYKHLESGNVPVYGTGGYMLSVNQALSESEDAVGIGRKGTIDKPYILRAPFWTVDTLFYCIPNEGFDLTFTNCLFQNVDWKKKDESTGVPSLSKVIINNVKTYVPSLEEQQKIASLFTELDSLIQSAEKELEGYRELKQGMLQKMFPKKGENVPEIRFPEFTGDWGQCKLGDVCKTYSGGTPKSGKSSYYDNGTIPFIRSGEIHNDRTELYITEKGMNESSAKMVDVGDILYALYGATSGEVDISKNNGAINQAILCIKPITGFDRKFIVETLRHNKESILRTYLQGGQGNLSAQIIQSQIFNFPCLAEQQRISEYFSNLDNLIALQQKELDGYKELKKGLLQQMFC